MSLHPRRHTIAVLLLSVFTLGGVMSPLAHLFWMAIGDFYQPMTAAHHATGAMGMEAGMAMPAGMDTGHSATLTEPGEDHFYCEYADLCVTTIPALMVEAPECDRPDSNEDLESATSSQVQSIRPVASSARAPPSGSTPA